MTTGTANTAALYSVENYIATITLNRADALNSVNRELSTAVGTYLEEAAADPNVRVVVITGTGRAFCAGADLKALAAGQDVSAEGHPEWGFGGFAQHWIDKPVIAAVNGLALGGGTEFVLGSDLVVAADSAKFGLPEAKRGLIAAAGGVVRTHRQIPLRRALELALIGDPIDAQTAYDWGLINRVVPADQVLETAYEIAGKIAANAPLSVQYTKRALHQTSSAGNDWNAQWSGLDPWEVNAEVMETVFSSEDAQEGPRAFSEKRAPQWSGK